METVELEKTKEQTVILNGLPKSKTQILLDKMERGEYVSDYEYLSSIPGYMEELDAALNEPLDEMADELDWD